MNRQRFALWLLLGGITAVLSAGPAFGTNLAIATNVPAPIATEAGVLRISVGSDITALGGESLRAAARSLVQPLIAAGIQFQTLILVDGSTDTDFQSYAYSDLF